MPLPRAYTVRNQPALDHVSEAWSIVERDNIGTADRARAIAHLRSAIAALTGEAVAAPNAKPAPDTSASNAKGSVQRDAAAVKAVTVKRPPKPKIPDELPTFPPELLAKIAKAEAGQRNRERMRVEHEGVGYYRCSRDGHWAPEHWYGRHSYGGLHSWCLRCMRLHTRESAAKVREKIEAASAEEAA